MARARPPRGSTACSCARQHVHCMQATFPTAGRGPGVQRRAPRACTAAAGVPPFRRFFSRGAALSKKENHPCHATHQLDNNGCWLHNDVEVLLLGRAPWCRTWGGSGGGGVLHPPRIAALHNPRRPRLALRVQASTQTSTHHHDCSSPAIALQTLGLQSTRGPGGGSCPGRTLGSRPG